MAVPQPIHFTKLIDALLDESTPFSPRYLNRLSDLDPADTSILSSAWESIPTTASSPSERTWKRSIWQMTCFVLKKWVDWP